MTQLALSTLVVQLHAVVVYQLDLVLVLVTLLIVTCHTYMAGYSMCSAH